MTLRKLVLALILVMAAMSLMPSPVAAAPIGPDRTISLSSSIADMEADPARPFVYLSASSNNSVLVFSIDELAIVEEVFVGSNPQRMDLDPATDRLYVALGGGPGVAVVDLKNRTRIAVWSAGGQTSDVAVGRPGRLYVTMGGDGEWTNPKILDTETGAVVGTINSPSSVYSYAILDISREKDYLYVGERGLSPASLYKLDVRTDDVTLVAEDDHGDLGSNLQDMKLSPDGRTIYLACGAPYYIQAIETSTITAAGQMDTGPYPSSVAVSGDGTTVLGGKFDFYDFSFYAFNATTFLNEATYSTTHEVYGLAIDPARRVVLAYSADTYYGIYWLDVYPSAVPPDARPTAAFAYAPASPMEGETVTFDASASTDPEGPLAWYEWDFGDGAWGSEVVMDHAYASAGTYTVRLTVADRLGQTATTQLLVEVAEPPLVAPVAAFAYAPASPTVGDLIVFDASASSDPYRPIIGYDWDFGDGSHATGATVMHTYQEAGAHPVTLTVTNSAGLTDTSVHEVSVAALPPIVLRPYAHASGFQLPIPEGWSLQENVTFGDSTVELFLFGPIGDASPSVIVVDTELNASVSEDGADLLQEAQRGWENISRLYPDAELVAGPELRTIAGHGAFAFTARIPSASLVQKIVYVASEAQGRRWVLFLTAFEGRFAWVDEAFERMLAAFAVDEPAGEDEPPPTDDTTPGDDTTPDEETPQDEGLRILGVPIGLIGPALVAVGAVVALVAVRAFRSRRPRGAPALDQGVSVDSPSTPARHCPACGAVTAPPHRFCPACGHSLPPRT